MTTYDIFMSVMMFFIAPISMYAVLFFLIREVVFKPYTRYQPPFIEELMLFTVGGGWICLLLPAMGMVSLIAMLLP